MRLLIDTEDPEMLVVSVDGDDETEFTDLLNEHNIFYKDKADDDIPGLGYAIIYEVDPGGLDLLKPHIYEDKKHGHKTRSK